MVVCPRRPLPLFQRHHRCARTTRTSRALPTVAAGELEALLPLLFAPCSFATTLTGRTLRWRRCKDEYRRAPLQWPTAYGSRSPGVFFLGYALFPRSRAILILARVGGARRWIARIVISWGLVALGDGAWCGRPFSSTRSASCSGGRPRGPPLFPGPLDYLASGSPAPARARLLLSRLHDRGATRRSGRQPAGRLAAGPRRVMGAARVAVGLSR